MVQTLEYVPGWLGVCKDLKVAHEQGFVGLRLLRGIVHLQLHLGHRELLLLLGAPQVPQVPAEHVGLHMAPQVSSLHIASQEIQIQCYAGGV